MSMDAKGPPPSWGFPPGALGCFRITIASNHYCIANDLCTIAFPSSLLGAPLASLREH